MECTSCPRSAKPQPVALSLSDRNLCIASYNSTGFGLGVQNYISTLLLFADILCVQEHFLQDCKDKKSSNTDKIRRNYGDKYDMYIVPAYKSSAQVCKGRGKGGLVTMWKKSLTKYVSQVPCSNFRLQATKFTFLNSSLLVINAYFPCDPQVDDFDDNEILAALADIEVLIRQAQCSDILLAGDLNSHFSRQTRLTNLVKDSFDDQGLLIAWQHPDSSHDHTIATIDYTHCSVARGVASLSIIDHLVTNQRVYDAISEAGVIHTGENPSNHSAIYAKINVEKLDLTLETHPAPIRVQWDKASSDAHARYRTGLSEKLSQIILPAGISCTDLQCKEHSDLLEEYTMEVVEAVQAAAKEYLPLSGGKAKGNKKGSIIAGWSEYVKPFAEDSSFWFSIWESLGRPNQGEIFMRMKQSKTQYKYAIRRLKRANDKIKKNMFLNSVIQGGSNIFKEIRKFRGKSCTFSSRIDNEVGAKNIANHFAGIYSELYNRVDLGEDLENVSDKINESINEDSKATLYRVNEKIVQEALENMEKNKHDEYLTISSDCFRNGPPELITHLTNLIRLFLSHGQVPSFVLLCTLIPLVKDNLGDITSSENYRAIAGGSLLLKLLDMVIIMLESDKLGFDSLQFAYQPSASTTMCSWTATAVIEHFNMHGTPVFGAAMDMSKAFDLVEWSVLFKTLLERKVDPILLRVMLYIYTHQQCDVKWSEQHSYSFAVKNGVRQGAVSSAILFAVYINELLALLRSSGLGCHIHGVFFGALVFADDILLLSASRSGLQTLVNMCQDFAASRNLKFGTNSDPEKSKTKCIAFSKNKRDLKNLHPVKLNDDPLPWVTRVKHLGNLLQCDNSMSQDIAQKRGKFIGKVNSLLQEFHFVEPAVLTKLINVYATSFYGAGTWDIFSRGVDKLYKSWNVAMRQVFKLDRTTHRYMIEHISGCLHPQVMLSSRLVTFHKSLVTCNKFPVRFLAKLNEKDFRTVLGRNLQGVLDNCDAQQLQGLS